MFETVLDVLIAAGVGIIALLILLILWELYKKFNASSEGVLASSSSQDLPEAPKDKPDASTAEKPTAPPKQETEAQRLARMEKELSARDAKAKAEKVRELQEREKVIRKRKQEEAKPQAEETPKDNLVSERARLQDLIKKAEERYYGGELEEKNFKRIVSSYQQQIIDLDITLRKKKAR
jgi:type IV secretory pathway VirB10-like protein